MESKEEISKLEYLNGKLSPCCLKSPYCPIVIRFMEKKSKISKFFSKIFKYKYYYLKKNKLVIEKK